MDNINNDAEDKLSPSSFSSSKLNDVQPVQQSQMDNLQEDKCRKPSEPIVVDKSKKNFFDRVDKMKVFKEEHGHLNVHHRKDSSLYKFCTEVRRSRTVIITGKGKLHNRLDDERIAALDAIGFEWGKSAGGSKDDRFFAQVDKLRAYEEQHGHVNVRSIEDQSLYDFCKNLRQSRQAIITGKGKGTFRLDETRIAALDAIDFNWNQGASCNAASKDDKFFAQVVKLKAYKETHSHLNVSGKEDRSLYDFCCSMRKARIGKGTYILMMAESLP
jgi:hypothetical protein